MDKIDLTNVRHQTYNASDYCSTDEAAKVLGVSLRTVRLWVESGALQAWKTPGGHRRITIQSLQKLVEERERVGQEPKPVQDPVAGTILVVDDDSDMLRLFELHISDWKLPLSLEFARDGFEALLKIGERRTAMLVTDLNMPGMDGFRMIRTLRANPLYRTLPIVVVTGMDKRSIEALGLPRDISVFSKPVPFADLRLAIENHLNTSVTAPAISTATTKAEPS